MEIIILSVVFIAIVIFCYTLWELAIREEKKEINQLFN
jgi:hypothetical protein